jgi:predicted DNA-binding protein (MmcQ/YjbR family)
MDAERARDFLRKLPHVEETIQWGANLVYWVGDKAVGGKMFAVLNLDADGMAVMSFSAGPERYHELIEIDGVSPAPYLARLSWVSIQHWGVIPGREVEALLRTAHEITYAKLPQKIKDTLALPAAEFQKLLTVRRKLLAEKSRKETAAKEAAAAAKKQAAKDKVDAKKLAVKKAASKTKKASRSR